jgi:hypothetical protein
MRSVTYSMGVSLDGYIAGPDGDFDWTPPGEEVFLSANALASSATGNATPSWINAHDMCRHISSLPGMPSASCTSRTAAPTATAACGATRDVNRPRAGGSNSPNPAS